MGLRRFAAQRGLPRLALHAHAERVRIHALSGRIETADRFLWEIKALDGDFTDEAFAVFRPLYELTSAIASTYASLARDDTEESTRQLEIADRLANALRRGRDIVDGQDIARHRRVSAQGFQHGTLVGRSHEPRRDRGLQARARRHPSACGAHRWRTRISPAPDRALRMDGEDVRPARRRVAACSPGRKQRYSASCRPASPNKRIARAMEISEETVKWHVKNLFFKLDANTRQHAVRRARLLGLLAG
jgi:LuxR family maltose regulon positive regulatory protein